jgi:hypothetical protein
VATAASTLNVPLPCKGTNTWLSWAVHDVEQPLAQAGRTALKSASHEPQSFSMASLVRSVVVSGLA